MLFTKNSLSLVGATCIVRLALWHALYVYHFSLSNSTNKPKSEYTGCFFIGISHQSLTVILIGTSLRARHAQYLCMFHFVRCTKCLLSYCSYLYLVTIQVQQGVLYLIPPCGPLLYQESQPH